MRLASILLLGISLAPSVSGQTTGTIKGNVVDENGKPLVGAKVHVAPTGPFYGSRIVDFHETDASGRFEVNRLPWATYAVMAGKEEAGYADTGGAFISNLDVPFIILSPATPSAEVTVHLGPKARVLDIGSVVNAVTGEKLNLKSGVTLRRADHPNFFMSTSVTVHPLFVPALTDVTMEIKAEGYKPWPAPDAPDRGRLNLKPGQVLKMDVKLQPESPSKSQAPPGETQH